MNKYLVRNKTEYIFFLKRILSNPDEKSSDNKHGRLREYDFSDMTEEEIKEELKCNPAFLKSRFDEFIDEYGEPEEYPSVIYYCFEDDYDRVGKVQTRFLLFSYLGDFDGDKFKNDRLRLRKERNEDSILHKVLCKREKALKNKEVYEPTIKEEAVLGKWRENHKWMFS